MEIKKYENKSKLLFFTRTPEELNVNSPGWSKAEPGVIKNGMTQRRGSKCF